MGTSDITVTALTATPGIGHNALKFSYSDPRDGALPAIALDVVEVHAASTNDRSHATKIDEGKDKAFHMALVEGQTYYYWAKARNRAGNYGDWFPSGATSGVIGTVGFAAGGSHALINGKLEATVGSNALTVAIKTLSGNDPSATNPVFVGFRDQSGTYTVRSIAAAVSLTVPSTATLGFTANDPSRVWVCLFDVGDGTVELAVRNCSTANTVFPLVESGLATTALCNTGADSAGVFYTDPALTSRPFRIAGYLEWSSGLATPGTWNVAPDIISLFGAGSKKPGDMVQTTWHPEAALITGAAAIPQDNTIPQSNEGNLYFTTALTPFSKTSILEHDVLFQGVGSVGFTLAIFKNAVADAICTAWMNGLMQQGRVVFHHRANAVAEQTFTVRGGCTSAVTLTMNGTGGDEFYGDTMISYHKIIEWMG